MNELEYDSKDKTSVINYAKKLEERTLRTICESKLSLNITEKSICEELIIEHKLRGKGKFGQIIEKFYFGYGLNSKKNPDFHEIGLELKTSPLKQLKIKDEYRAKERLVLSIINYEEVLNTEFESSDLWQKNAHLLLIFYLYKEESDVLDYLIKLVGEWEFPEIDLELIKKDWEHIKDKIQQGRAHELSEGDTMYLGACTKGANSKTTRNQPRSGIPAKQRAFSLKQGYVNHIIASLSNEKDGVYGKLIQSAEEVKNNTIETIVTLKFQKYYNKTIDSIIEKTGVNLNKKAKNFYASLTKAILGIELNKEIEEFEKAEIIVKTVRLKDNNMPKEDVSFPTFKYKEIVEENWDKSQFKEILEHKFLFVFLQYEDDKLVLRKVKFWNMPYSDKEEAKKVWEKTKRIVSKGEIVKNIEGNKRKTNFPSKKDSTIAHVRPHAKNAADTYPLHKKDKITKEEEYTKHCFWLNSKYVRDEIFLKD